MNIFIDWQLNKSNPKAKFILSLFRLCGFAKKNKVLFILFSPILIFYRVLVEWILGVEIPYKTIIGKGLTIYHGHALVVNDNSIIGEYCTLRHCTTIGNKMLSDGSYSNSPIIGDNVDIGSNVCIIGAVSIGDNVKIGAGSVVVKNIPSNSIVVGNPARIIKKI